MKQLAGAIFLGFVLLFPDPARADTVVKKDCHTADRVAAFAALLRTKPERWAAESFISKNNVTREESHPVKKRALMIASIGDSDCDPMDYQHDRHVFYIRFEKHVAVSFTQALASGGP